MGRIVFDLLIILGNIWVITDEDMPKISKRLSLLAVVLLVISVILQVLDINGIV